MADKQESEGLRLEWQLVAQTQGDGAGGWYALEMHTQSKTLRQLHYKRGADGKLRVNILAEPFGAPRHGWRPA